MLMTEHRRLELMARVLRKEYLAQLCERGKIAPEQYLQAVNAMREDEQLPPLTLADAPMPVARPLRRNPKASR